MQDSIFKYTNLGPFLLCLMSVAQQVTDAMCSDSLETQDTKKNPWCQLPVNM